MSEKDERGRGILTPQDREFLRGEREHISQGSKYNTRRRIRERIEDAILDFSLLLDEFDDRDRERVFGPRKRFVPTDEHEDVINIRPEESVDPAMRRALIDAVAFLYGASRDAGIFPRQVVESGFWEAYPREHPDREIREVNLDVEWDNREDLLDAALYNLQDGRTLSAPQLRVLMESDEVSDEELLKIREHVRRQPRGSVVKRDLGEPTQTRIGPRSVDGSDDLDAVRFPSRRDMAEVIRDAQPDELKEDSHENDTVE